MVTRGRNQPGFCKLCDGPWADAINKLIQQDKNEAEVKRSIKLIDPEYGWDRRTFYDHKEHVTSPLVTYQKQALANPVVVPKTNTGALEAIRDIGMRRVVEHPEEVTVDHTLKALSVLEQRHEKRDTVWVVLAKAHTNQLPEIEGVWEQVPAEEEQ